MGMVGFGFGEKNVWAFADGVKIIAFIRDLEDVGFLLEKKIPQEFQCLHEIPVRVG